MPEITEADIIEERRVPDRDEVADILARYFVASGPEVADRLHAVIVELVADPSRYHPELSSFRANSRNSFGQAWKEELSRGRSNARVLDLVAWIAATKPGYPAPKPYCPPPLVGHWRGDGHAWQLDGDGTAAIDNPVLAATKRWCVHRSGDNGPAGDALWLYDDVDDQRWLFIEDVGAVLRVKLLDNDDIYELAKDTTRGPARTTLEMGFAVRMAPCPTCGRHDLVRYDVHGEGTAWTLAGHCAGCDQGRAESFRTIGDPYKTQHPMGEIGAGPTLMFTAAELVAELARIERRLTMDPRNVPPEAWPEQLANIHQALSAATELRKLIPADGDALPDGLGTRASVEAIHPRYIAILRAYEAESDRLTPSRPPSIGEISRESIRAHGRWIEKRRSGPGRLVVAHVDASGEKIGHVQMTAAKLDDVTLDGAGLNAVCLDEAELTAVTFVGAGLDDATFTKATITGCSFVRARLAISRFDGTTITASDFSKSDLERSHWKDARVTRATFTGARFGNASLDGTTFTGCDFREASFAALLRMPLPTTAARFEDCDLRDTDWTGRSLDDTRFVRCKLAGAHGAPHSRDRLVIEDCDVAPEQFL